MVASRKIFPATGQTVKRRGAVKRALFALLAFVVTSTFAKTTVAPEVTFISPCECPGFHGKNRWITKTDLSPVPVEKSAIQSVTPSQIYAWEGLGLNVELTRYTETRMPSEQKWYALTGRVVSAKVEADGDIHMELQDATGDRVGTVSAEIRWPKVVRDPADRFRLDDTTLSLHCQNRAHA